MTSGRTSSDRDSRAPEPSAPTGGQAGSDYYNGRASGPVNRVRGDDGGRAEGTGERESGSAPGFIDLSNVGLTPRVPFPRSSSSSAYTRRRADEDSRLRELADRAPTPGAPGSSLRDGIGELRPTPRTPSDRLFGGGERVSGTDNAGLRSRLGVPDAVTVPGDRYARGPLARLTWPERAAPATPERALPTLATPSVARRGSTPLVPVAATPSDRTARIETPRLGDRRLGSGLRPEPGTKPPAPSSPDNVEGLRRLAREEPALAREISLSGRALAKAQIAALRVGIGSYSPTAGRAVIGGFYSKPKTYGGSHVSIGFHFGLWNHCSYQPYWWKYSPCHSWWYWPLSFSCYWPSYYWNYCGPIYSYVPAYYPAAYYGGVVYNQYYYGSSYGQGYSDGYSAGAYSQPVGYSEPAYSEPVGEAVAAPPGRVAQQTEELPPIQPLSSAAERYLTLGDRAFRESRYRDAVTFYAKAIEFAPDQGVLYLVLGDALFATGDYHYGAYAIRRALELDPSLLESVVDKHDFYADPLEFDRQLAVLERYLEDHVRDDDARLVLATNYLFGNRPAAAVDLLEEPFAAGLKSDTAALMVLSTARSVQYSLLQMRSEADAAAADPTPVGAGETLESGETDD